MVGQLVVTLVLIEAAFIFGYVSLEIMEKYHLDENVNKIIRSVALVIQGGTYVFYAFLSIHFYFMGIRYAQSLIWSIQEGTKLFRTKLIFGSFTMMLIVYYILEFDQVLTPLIYLYEEKQCPDSYEAFKSNIHYFFIVVNFLMAMLIPFLTAQIISICLP